MNHLVVSLIGRNDDSYDDLFEYKVSDAGELGILDKGRAVAIWAGVSRQPKCEAGRSETPRDYFSSGDMSPSVLGEMNQYVSHLAGAKS
jgi:hypothetical protein